ncbi:MAG TPA: homoserine dehydrogenase [Polyangia bacterium]|jgi:homoserine dehydrogenase|nr:homoserine dehydrogenase [Polyangia bacterium]
MRTISVGLLGLGNVGSGVVKLLADNADAIRQRLGGSAVAIRRIAVREADKPRLVDVAPALITTDVNAVLGDPEIEIVVELIGGEEPARAYLLDAIARGKHIVTANKALLAAHGEEIFAAAAERGVDVYYEASVGGGVPIIRALREGLASDRVDELVAIVNGTSNFLLTTMTEEGRPFDAILEEAQKKGYAEADPSLDVDGWDAAHKLCVLVPLCFGTRIAVSQVLVEGLRGIEPIDFRYAERFGYVIKPLVIGKDHGDSVEARVHPTLIPRRFMLASVNGVYNAVYVSSYALGNSMYYGRGAGMMPTAVAVVSDVIEVSRNLLSSSAGGSPLRASRRRGDMRERRIRDPGELSSRYYLRFGVVDKPGVLAQLAGMLGEHDISISEVVQEGQRQEGKPVIVVVTTHRALEKNVQGALGIINRLPTVREPTRLLRIFE